MERENANVRYDTTRGSTYVDGNTNTIRNNYRFRNRIVRGCGINIIFVRGYAWLFGSVDPRYVVRREAVRLTGTQTPLDGAPTRDDASAHNVGTFTRRGHGQWALVHTASELTRDNDC